MSLIIIAAVIWGICKLISAASAASRERARQAQLERIRREQERVKLEQARQHEAWKAAQAAERERVRQMVALEREQARQAKEQERLAKEQERQAVQLARHEEEIKQLKYRVRRCEQTYTDMRQRIENLEELYELTSAELEEADRVGDDKRKEKALRKIVTLDSQLASARDKQRKAKHDWNTAKQKLSA